MDAKLDARASVQLLPERSQIFVAVLALMSFGALAVGCFFLWYEKSGAWAPLLFSALFLLAAIRAWFVSHRNVDLQGAHPTRVQMTQNGLQLEADPRLLASNEQFRQLEKIVAFVGHRMPLPEPDGLVSPTGHPLPEAKARAVAMVNALNEQAQQATVTAARFLCGSSGDAQTSIATEVPVQPAANKPSLSGNQIEP